MSKSLKKNLEGYAMFMAPPAPCPKPCYVHNKCEDCLDARGGEGGSQKCYWSEALREVCLQHGIGLEKEHFLSVKMLIFYYT